MIKPIKFTIMVLSSPYSGQSAHTAYHFAHAVLAKGHRINRIFFYDEGIYNALAASELAASHYDIANRWRALKQNHDLPLSLCSTASLKRGVIEPGGGFSQSGLGQLIEAISESDRFISFG